MSDPPPVRRPGRLRPVPHPLRPRLATARFIQQREDALFLGPPGTGKSHLAQAIGRAAIQQGYRVTYHEAHTLLEEVAEAAVDGTRKALLTDLATVPLLIIDPDESNYRAGPGRPGIIVPSRPRCMKNARTHEYRMRKIARHAPSDGNQGRVFSAVRGRDHGGGNTASRPTAGCGGALVVVEGLCAAFATGISHRGWCCVRTYHPRPAGSRQQTRVLRLGIGSRGIYENRRSRQIPDLRFTAVAHSLDRRRFRWWYRVGLGTARR
jgi:IstB-like ATP binding protein